jgi:hypothetical protein
LTIGLFEVQRAVAWKTVEGLPDCSLPLAGVAARPAAFVLKRHSLWHLRHSRYPNDDRAGIDAGLIARRC